MVHNSSKLQFLGIHHLGQIQIFVSGFRSCLLQSLGFGAQGINWSLGVAGVRGVWMGHNLMTTWGHQPPIPAKKYSGNH